MITAAARRTLKLGDLEKDLQEATAAVGGLRLRNSAGPTNTQDWSATSLDPAQQTGVKMKAALLAAAEKLDGRLREALAGNSTRLLLHSILVMVLLVVAALAIALAIVKEWPLVGVVGGVVPAAVIAWSLAQHRTLQDERIWLMVLLGRYELLIVSCNEPPGLRLIAEQLAETLKRLEGSAPA